MSRHEARVSLCLETRLVTCNVTSWQCGHTDISGNPRPRDREGFWISMETVWWRVFMNKTLLRTFCQTGSYCITLCLSFKSSVSHKILHISQIVGFFVLLVVNFSWVPKFSSPKASCKYHSGLVFSLKHNFDYSFVAEKKQEELWWAREIQWFYGYLGRRVVVNKLRSQLLPMIYNDIFLTIREQNPE